MHVRVTLRHVLYEQRYTRDVADVDSLDDAHALVADRCAQAHPDDRYEFESLTRIWRPVLAVVEAEEIEGVPA